MVFLQGFLFFYDGLHCFLVLESPQSAELPFAQRSRIIEERKAFYGKKFTVVSFYLGNNIRKQIASNHCFNGKKWMFLGIKGQKTLNRLFIKFSALFDKIQFQITYWVFQLLVITKIQHAIDVMRTHHNNFSHVYKKSRFSISARQLFFIY